MDRALLGIIAEAATAKEDLGICLPIQQELGFTGNRQGNGLIQADNRAVFAQLRNSIDGLAEEPESLLCFVKFQSAEQTHGLGKTVHPVGFVSGIFPGLFVIPEPCEMEPGMGIVIIIEGLAGIDCVTIVEQPPIPVGIEFPCEAPDPPELSNYVIKTI